MMLTIGWLTFLAAWIMNILFYKVHPSAVDFSPKRMKEKMFIYIFGKKYSLLCSPCHCCGCSRCCKQAICNKTKFYLQVTKEILSWE